MVPVDPTGEQFNKMAMIAADCRLQVGRMRTRSSAAAAGSETAVGLLSPREGKDGTEKPRREASEGNDADGEGQLAPEEVDLGGSSASPALRIRHRRAYGLTSPSSSCALTRVMRTCTMVLGPLGGSKWQDTRR